VFRTLILVVSLVFCATAAAAEEYEPEKLQDCRYFSTRMVMSTTSGAIGHVISGDFNEQNKSCRYDIRFALSSGNLVMVKEMRDYELEFAPKFTGTSGERMTAPARAPKAPKDPLADLNFGRRGDLGD
jgi:hypothetical protein